MTRLAETMVGMANTSGGTILLGVAPRSGYVQGVVDISKALDRVFQAALLADPPLVLPVPETVPAGEGQVLRLSIPPGLPHIYNLDGRYLWREGSQTNPIPPRRLHQLLLERGERPFEAGIPLDATLEDLDQELVNAYARIYAGAFKEGKQEAAQRGSDILVERGCLRLQSGAGRPTYAALLLFGRTPGRWLPAATILAARFSGRAFGDRFVKQDIGGALVRQLEQVEAFLQANLRSVVRLIGWVRQEEMEVPLEAVRELIVNAVAHRDYNLQGDHIHLNIFADRLEVTSPGGLPGPVNLTNLLETRYARNPVIIQILSDFGYGERLGYGLDRVVALMRERALRPPVFQENAGSFKVTLFNEPASGGASPGALSRLQELRLNPRQEAALKYLAAHRRITSSEYQDLCPEVHAETLRRDLADLVGQGILLKIGDKRATYYILK